MVNAENTSKSMNTDETCRQAPDALLAEQIVEVYEAAPQVVRTQMITQLVVNVFESASPIVRRLLLERLLRPLGVLSLVAVAGGIFAKIPFRSNWRDVRVQIEDVQNVRASDLAALVDHVQQVSVEAVAGIAQTIAASPGMAGSAAAAVLVAVLVKHRRIARANDRDDDGLPAVPI